MLKKILIAGTLLSCFLFFFATPATAQKWKKSKPNTLFARNKKKNTTPIFVGIGTSNPSAQLHTTGSVRFEALANNNVLNNVVAIDNNGNLFWKDISNISAANAWNIIGNVATATNFLGTTNNEDLRIRTNNLQRAVITSTGSLGLGVSSPTAQLHSNGTVRFQGLLNGTGNPLVADANGNIFIGTNPVLNAWNLIGNSPTATDFLGTTNNEDLRIRTNNLQRAVITNTGSLGLGVSVPTAQLHTNGTVRFQGLANGTGNALVTDANGNVFVGSPIPNSWNLAGNTGTNPSTNFLGTTDNVKLAVRTNNIERITVLADGKVGINETNPTVAQLNVSSNTADSHIRVNGVAPSVVFLGNLGPTEAGRIGYATQNNNYTTGSLPGDLIVQTLGNTSNLILGTGGGLTGNGFERARINSVGYFGISTFNPSAKLHVNCSLVSGQPNPSNIRFENLQAGTGTALVIDANGYVYSSTNPISNSWSLTGNAGTNPGTNFLGTTDNVKLAVRTNNIERITVLPDGKVGINETNPAVAQLNVSSNTADSHIRVNGVAPSVVFLGNLGPTDAGRIGYATQNNNYTSGSLPGDLIVQTLGNTSNLILGTGGGLSGNGFERARINSVGYFGISTFTPSAKLHVNCALIPGQPNPSNVRLENLQTGTGSALVIDANGYVYKSGTLIGKAEMNELKEEIQDLKKEIEELKSAINSIKKGTLTISENDNTNESAVLYQNTPNPFQNTTTIRYYISNESKNASLLISDLQGKVLRSYQLNGKGQQYTTINGGELTAGTYLYTLMVDGKNVDSKKMVLTR